MPNHKACAAEIIQVEIQLKRLMLAAEIYLANSTDTDTMAGAAQSLRDRIESAREYLS